MSEEDRRAEEQVEENAAAQEEAEAVDDESIRGPGLTDVTEWVACTCGTCRKPRGAPESQPYEIDTSQAVELTDDPHDEIRGVEVEVIGTMLNGYCVNCGDHCYADGTVALRRGIGNLIGGVAVERNDLSDRVFALRDVIAEKGGGRDGSDAATSQLCVLTDYLLDILRWDDDRVAELVGGLLLAERGGAAADAIVETAIERTAEQVADAHGPDAANRAMRAERLTTLSRLLHEEEAWETPLGDLWKMLVGNESWNDDAARTLVKRHVEAREAQAALKGVTTAQLDRAMKVSGAVSALREAVEDGVNGLGDLLEYLLDTEAEYDEDPLHRIVADLEGAVASVRCNRENADELRGWTREACDGSALHDLARMLPGGDLAWSRETAEELVGRVATALSIERKLAGYDAGEARHAAALIHSVAENNERYTVKTAHVERLLAALKLRVGDGFWRALQEADAALARSDENVAKVDVLQETLHGLQEQILDRA